MESSVIANAKKSYTKYFGPKSSLVCLYGVFVLLILALGFLFWPTLVVTIPLLFMPFTFSFIICNAYASEGKFKAVMFFGFFPVYFRHMFHGGFRGLHALLKAFIVFLIITTIVSLILTFTVLIPDKAFMDIIHQIQVEKDASKLNLLYEELTNNPALNLFAFIQSASALGCAFYSFLHHIFTHSPKMYFSVFSAEPIRMRDINIVHKISFPSFRKDFYKEYYSVMWINAILYAVGYCGGVCLAYFAFNIAGLGAPIIGLAIALILNLFVIPFSFDVIEELFKKHRKDYALGFIKASQNIINSKQGKDEIGDEQRAKLEEILNKQKEEILKENKEDKNSSNDENK